LAMMDVDSAGELFAAPQAAQPPPIDPIKAADIQLKMVAEENKKAKMVFDAKEKAKDRESRQNLEVLKLASALAVHPESDGIVDSQIMQLSPLMSNIKTSMNQGGLGGLGPPLRFAPPRPMMPPMQQGMR
jgi:hypothetical protein